jgi:protein SCO1/2
MRDGRRAVIARHRLPRLAWVVLLAGAGAAWCAPPQQPQHHEVLAPAAAIPGESIYQLLLDLTDSQDRTTPLDSLKGKPVVVAMFYTSCEGVCPMIAFAMRRMEAKLSEPRRSRVQWLLVSFDAGRDTPRALRAFAERNRIDRPGWSVARTAEASVRELAAVLGVRYRQLPDGNFSHSSVITLLDAEGRIVARTSELAGVDESFFGAVRGIAE